MNLPPQSPRLIVAFLFLAGLDWASPAWADEQYYLIVFGSQTTPKLPRFDHTWGTLVRVTSDESNPGHLELQADTISWLPRTLKVRPFKPLAEPGVNLDLDSTIRFVLAQGQRVSAWGPYQIDSELYYRALQQKAHLESGQVRYKAIDSTSRTSSASDCIHALTDLDRAPRRLFYNEVIRNGDCASHFVVHILHVRGKIINPGSRHDWILESLDLSCYPIWHRQYNGRRYLFLDDKSFRLP